MFQLALDCIAGGVSRGVVRDANSDCGREAVLVYLAIGMARSCAVAEWGGRGGGVTFKQKSIRARQQKRRSTSTKKLLLEKSSVSGLL